MKKNIVATSLVAPFIIIILAIIFANTLYNRLFLSTDSAGVQSFTELFYCSTNTDQCQEGVSTIDYVVKSRNAVNANTYGYNTSYRAQVKLSEIEIKLNTKASDYIVGEYSLFSDSNSDGAYDESDKKLVSGFAKKKRLVFESINFVTDFSAGENIHDTNTFFIVSEEGQVLSDVLTLDEEGEPLTLKAIDKITVKATNIANNNSPMVNESSVVDRSIFDHTTERELTKQEFLNANTEFTAGAGDEVVLSGGHVLLRDIIVPTNLRLTVKPGTVVKLDPGVSIVSYSPASFKGTKQSPIVFENNQDEPFGVVSVLVKLKVRLRSRCRT